VSDSHETGIGSQDSEMEEEESLPPPAKQAERKVVTQKLRSLLGKVMQFNWPFVHLLDGLSQIDPDLLSALSDEPKPFDFFSFFLHDELIAILVHETNCYAELYVANASLGPE